MEQHGDTHFIRSISTKRDCSGLGNAGRYARLCSSAACLIAFASATLAEEEINNGTNPIKLTSQIALQYQFNQIDSNLNTGLLEFAYTKPFGDMSQSFRLTVPFSDSPFNANPTFGDTAAIAAANPSVGNEMRLGDISLMFIKVFGVTEKNGAAATFELFLDTAETPTAGYGQFAAEASAYYAWFLDNGSIFSPAIVHTFGLEGGNSLGVDVNTTTIDFYYVPKLPTSKYYMTFDPAIIHDWENDATFGSLQVTFGIMTGKAFGGDSQLFIKPGVLFGGDAPADWSVQFGYKILNF